MAAHNPHGAGNPYDLEIALEQDLLITSVGWANSYYGEGSQYVDEWGVGWQAVSYKTPYGGVTTPSRAGIPSPTPTPRRSQATNRPTPTGRSSTTTPAAHRRARGRVLHRRVHRHHDLRDRRWALRGLEQLLTDFIEDPDLADAILEIPYRYHLAAAETLVRMGVDMIWLGDDVGQQQGMLISPRHWRRFLKPRMADHRRAPEGASIPG